MASVLRVGPIVPHLEVLGTTISPEIRDWLMAELRIPVLAVLQSDGSPNQSAMWFDLDPDAPDTVLMNTRPERAKARLIKRDPRVSLCFVEGFTWVALRGRAEIDDDPERGAQTIAHLARRYGRDPSIYTNHARVTVLMTVERVIRYGD